MKIYIARDSNSECETDNDGTLCAYRDKPYFAAGEWWRTVPTGAADDAFMILPTPEFPEIKNGECREAEIVLK